MASLLVLILGGIRETWNTTKGVILNHSSGAPCRFYGRYAFHKVAWCLQWTWGCREWAFTKSTTCLGDHHGLGNWRGWGPKGMRFFEIYRHPDLHGNKDTRISILVVLLLHLWSSPNNASGYNRCAIFFNSRTGSETTPSNDTKLKLRSRSLM